MYHVLRGVKNSDDDGKAGDNGGDSDSDDNDNDDRGDDHSIEHPEIAVFVLRQ